MSQEDLEEPSPVRRRLADRLRQLRLDAGLTGEQLAAGAGLSQPKVSRIENARQAPQLRDVEAWLREAGAPAQARDEVLGLAEAALTETVDWRRELRAGRGAKQVRIGQREAAASVIRIWQPLMVPGLLQTAEYARRVFGFAREAPWDLAEATKARMDRQAVLFDQRKQLVFLVGETALRRRIAPPQVLLGQLDRILSLLDLPNVEIGLLPLDGEVTELDLHPYSILGDPGADEDVAVLAATVADELVVRDADKVAAYLDHFDRVRGGAVVGAEARALLARVAVDLRG